MASKKKKDPVYTANDQNGLRSKFRKFALADVRDEKNSNKKKKNILKNEPQITNNTSKNTRFKKVVIEEIPSDVEDSDYDELKDDSDVDDLSEYESDEYIPDESDEEINISSSRSNRKVSIDASKLKIKSQQEKISQSTTAKGLFKLVSDIDPEMFKKQCEGSIPIETLQSNIKAIRELDTLSRSKPNRSTRNSISSVSSDTPLKDNLTIFENALKDLPESFNIPKTTTKPTCSSSSSSSARDLDDDGELSLSYISEIILGMEDKSIERRGQDLIQEISDIPFRSRKEEEDMMREPLPFERQCINGDKCEALFINKSNGIPGFIMVEFPSKEDMTYYNQNNRWPRPPPPKEYLNHYSKYAIWPDKDDIPDPEDLSYYIQHKKWPYTGPMKCVICSRKEMTDVWVEDLSKSSLRKDGTSTTLCSEALYHNKIGPGEYSPSDVFMTDSNRINASILPIVMHARPKYQMVTRRHTSGIELKYYNQKMTDPSSFRVGRTQAQSSGSMNSVV